MLRFLFIAGVMYWVYVNWQWFVIGIIVVLAIIIFAWDMTTSIEPQPKTNWMEGPRYPDMDKNWNVAVRAYLDDRTGRFTGDDLDEYEANWRA